MTRALLVLLHDDDSAPPATPTVYELDLEHDDSGEICRALRAHLGSALQADDSPAAIRAWARRHNIPVSERGRLPANLVDSFHRSALSPGAATVDDDASSA